jgi:hypothetical protein
VAEHGDTVGLSLPHKRWSQGEPGKTVLDKEQAPTGESTVVFRDSAFADDVAKTNLTAILQQHGLENVRSL